MQSARIHCGNKGREKWIEDLEDAYNSSKVLWFSFLQGFPKIPTRSPLITLLSRSGQGICDSLIEQGRKFYHTGFVQSSRIYSDIFASFLLRPPSKCSKCIIENPRKSYNNQTASGERNCNELLSYGIFIESTFFLYMLSFIIRWRQLAPYF